MHRWSNRRHRGKDYIRGIVSAVVIGVIGGLFPAIRVARLPVAVALREK